MILCVSGVNGIVTCEGAPCCWVCTVAKERTAGVKRFSQPGTQDGSVAAGAPFNTNAIDTNMLVYVQLTSPPPPTVIRSHSLCPHSLMVGGAGAGAQTSDIG